jgi:hypothetical protein
MGWRSDGSTLRMMSNPLILFDWSKKTATFNWVPVLPVKMALLEGQLMADVSTRQRIAPTLNVTTVS